MTVVHWRELKGVLGQWLCIKTSQMSVHVQSPANSQHWIILMLDSDYRVLRINLIQNQNQNQYSFIVPQPWKCVCRSSQKKRIIQKKHNHSKK